MRPGILKKIRLSAFKIGLLLTAVVIAVFFLKPSFLEIMELKALDLRFRLRGEIKPGPEVVIVAIDEKSLDQIGRWPWPRAVMSRIVEKLSHDGPRVIGFDIVFSEPEISADFARISSLQKEIEKLDIGGDKLQKLRSIMERARREADHDRLLAEAMERSGRCVLGYFFHFTSKGLEHVAEEKFDQWLQNIRFSKYRGIKYAHDIDLRRISLQTAYAVESNIDVISAAARGAGYFNFHPDPDGTVRRLGMIIKYREMVGGEKEQDMVFPPLSVKVLEEYLGAIFFFNINRGGVGNLRIKDIVVPTNEMGEMLINFYGPSRTFPQYSAADVVQDRVPPGTFKNKIVLIGPTAVGIYDMRTTPLDPVFSGVEIHANVLDNILHRRFIYCPQWMKYLEVLLILCFGIAMALALPRTKALGGILLALMLVAIFLFANYKWLFVQKGIWLNVVYPSLNLFLCYTGITVYHFMSEEKEKRKIKGAFQHYVTASVVNEMLKDPSKLKLGGDKKDLSVLFSDIRGFTTFSESIQPEMLVKLLNEYLTAMTDIIFQYEGTLDKYMGDAIMAIYGAPLPQQDHARRACLTALEMMDELRMIQIKWGKDGYPHLDIGIGINSGLMVVGNMGSERRFDYTVMGDSVNLGSRLEGLNKIYGTNVIIGDETYERVKSSAACREIDLVRVKGKAQPVKIYELMAMDGASDEIQSLVSAFQKAMRYYRAKRFAEAGQLFKQIQLMHAADGPSKLYLGRCALLAKEPPPPNWDGVFTITKK